MFSMKWITYVAPVFKHITKMYYVTVSHQQREIVLLLERHRDFTGMLLKAVNRCHAPVYEYSTDGANKTATELEKKKVEFLLLLDTNGKILGTRTKEEALAFAKKHDYHLVKVDDPHHAEAKKRKVYQLVTSKQLLLQQEAKSDEKPEQSRVKQVVKNVITSSKITENDLNYKIKNIHKWLEKRCEVRVGITGMPGATQQLEDIFKKFEASFAGVARILQKRIKNGALKFVIMPPPEKKVSQNIQGKVEKNED